MGSLEVHITQYGTWDVTTSTGAHYRLNERDGRLEVRVQDGGVAVHPRGANAVEIAAVDWDGREVGQPTLAEAWERGGQDAIERENTYGAEAKAQFANPYAGGGRG